MSARCASRGYSDGTCPHCRAGITSACLRGGVWGANGIDGGQGEAVRVPLADGTLVKVPGSGHSDETLASLLTLSDVMCTGHHAAKSAEVKQGDTVAARQWAVIEWVMSGTHTGDFPRMPATGKRFSSVRGASILELEAGKIRRESDYWDAATFMKQVGLLPSH